MTKKKILLLVDDLFKYYVVLISTSFSSRSNRLKRNFPRGICILTGKFVPFGNYYLNAFVSLKISAKYFLSTVSMELARQMVYSIQHNVEKLFPSEKARIICNNVMISADM